MPIAKRPKLATRYTGPRAGSRDFVSLEGRCRVGDSAETAIAILDLDARGCRVKGIVAAVTKADALLLWLGEVGPVAAKLKWVKRGSAGIAFETPLSDADLIRVAETAAPAPLPQVVPLRRASLRTA